MRNSPTENSATYTASPSRKHKGLTLIELLVAISVLALIAVLGWRGLDSIVRARIALTDDLEQIRGMQLAFAQLQSDCSHLASAAVLPNRMPLIVEQERLTLVRTVFTDNQPSRLQIITYRIKNGILTRRESAATRNLSELDSLMLTTANDTNTDQAVVLQSGVTALTMRLWINGGWRTNIDTQPAGMPDGMDAGLQTPTGLEISTKLQGHEGNLIKIFLLGTV